MFIKELKKSHETVTGLEVTAIWSGLEGEATLRLLCKNVFRDVF